MIYISYALQIPNLGGLARTCEIFAAESLVLHDIRVAADQVFKDVSVTANQWMSLHECPPEVRSTREREYVTTNY